MIRSIYAQIEIESQHDNVNTAITIATTILHEAPDRRAGLRQRM